MPVPKRPTAEEAQFEAQKLAFAPIIFQAARILRDGGLLEAVSGRDGASLPDIASATGFSEYACTVLLEAGLAANAVQKQNDDTWKLTKVGYFLLKDPLTRVNMDFTQDVCYLAMDRLEDSLREGRPAGLEVFGDWPTIYEGLMELPEKAKKSWLAFDHYYSDDSFPIAARIVLDLNPERILDIGGNVGKFAAVCTKISDTVRMTIVDLPKTLERARQNLETHGVADRVDLRATNMLDSKQALPEGHDVIWMSQFLCCFSEEEVVSILERCRKALAEGGRVVIMDTFWDEQRYAASSYCLQATSLYFTCLANGNSRMYDLKTLTECIAKAGLKVDMTHRNIGLSHTILECVPS
jgi:predicted O-methyltransferase YrrM